MAQFRISLVQYKFYPMNSFPCVVCSNCRIPVASTWFAYDMIVVRMLITEVEVEFAYLFIILSILCAISPLSFMLGHEPLVTVYIRIWFRIVCVVVTSSFPAPEHLGVYLCSLKQFLSTCTSGSSSMNNSSCYFLINLKVNISIPRSWALQKLLANFRHLKSNSSFEMLL